MSGLELLRRPLLIFSLSMLLPLAGLAVLTIESLADQPYCLPDTVRGGLFLMWRLYVLLILLNILITIVTLPPAVLSKFLGDMPAWWDSLGRVFWGPCCIAPIFLAFLGLLVYSRARTDTTTRNINSRSSPLVKALDDFYQSHGRYPDNLEALVPQFISKLPEAGMCHYNKFVYGSKGDYQTFSLALIDGASLSQSFKPGWMSGLSHFNFDPATNKWDAVIVTDD